MATITPSVGLKGLRGTLEVALESDDLSPLVKLVCSSGPRQATGDQGSSPLVPAAVLKDETLPIAEGTLAAVIQSLQGISDRRELELKRTCQANAADIHTAMKELTTVQTTSADLRRRLQETAASMQRMGANFSSRMDALQEALVVRDRIQSTRAVLTSAIQIISFCQEAAESIENGQLFHARRILTKLQTAYGPALEAAAGGNVLESENIEAEAAVAAELGTLAGLLLSRISELEGSLEAQLAAGFNDWLTRARSVAGAVGRRAMDLIEEERIEFEILAEQRTEILQSIAQFRARGGGRTSFLGQTSAGLIRIVSPRSNSGELLTRKTGVGAEEASDAHTEKLEESVDHGDPASVLDMTLLLRNVHLYSASGTLPQFLEAYVDSRQAQLGADLALPGSFLSFYRTFLWQIVGYFVIESRVVELIPQLGSAANAEAAWEGASAALAAEIGAAIDEANKPEDIRKVKNQALLACDAIDRCCGDMLPTRGIRSTLTKRVERHRFTLAGLVAAALEAAALDDVVGMEDAVIQVAFSCQEYLYGLVEAHDLPAATFNECDRVLAAAMATEVAAYVSDQNDYVSDEEDEEYDSEEDEEGSWASEDEEEERREVYSSGEASPRREESGSAIRKEENLLGHALARQLKEGNVEESDVSDSGGDSFDDEEEFAALLRLVAMAAAVDGALEALRCRLFGAAATVAASAGAAVSPRAPQETPILSTTQLSGVLASIEDAVGRLICDDAEPAVDALLDLNWAPHSMSRSEGSITPQCQEMLEVLHLAHSEVQAASLPAASQERILGAAGRRLGSEVLRVLASDDVAEINYFGAQMLLRDLQALSQWCQKVAGEKTGALWLEGPVRFIEAVAFNSLSDFIGEQKRGGKLLDLNYERAASILEKIEDPPPGSEGVGSSAGGRGALGRGAAVEAAAVMRGLGESRQEKE